MNERKVVTPMSGQLRIPHQTPTSLPWRTLETVAGGPERLLDQIRDLSQRPDHRCSLQLTVMAQLNECTTLRKPKTLI